MNRPVSRRGDNRLRIVVLGFIVRGPLGGLVWHYLQYVMGLAQLGHDVFFVEDSGDSVWCCYDPSTGDIGTDPSYGMRFAEELFEKVGLGERWMYYDAHKLGWIGPCGSRAVDIIADADLVLNVSGCNILRDVLSTVPVRALIDTDPTFMQVRNLKDPAALEVCVQCNRFFTFGENISSPATPIPRDGLPWQPTRQPIVLDAWQVLPPAAAGLFTTIMSWDSYQSAEYEGVRYGMKSESFGPYMSLPAKVGPIFEISLGSPVAPRDELMQAGWRLRNPMEFDPWSYKRYIQQSKAEFTVAKQAYVISHSGWFSERSAAYLASGRPVITQETGFSDWLETGCGVLSFQTPEQAVAAIEQIDQNYEGHCAKARILAETYFDASLVLTHLIERAMESATAGEGNART